LVLGAIDNGIIKRGMTFTEIQRLFGEENVRLSVNLRADRLGPEFILRRLRSSPNHQILALLCEQSRSRVGTWIWNFKARN
jgi:hypothetical protein